MVLTWPCRWHSAAAATPSSELISCRCSLPSCPCQKVGCRHEAHSSTLRGPDTARERDGWGLSCQVLDRPLPRPPATSSKGRSAITLTHHVLSNAELVQGLSWIVVMLPPYLCSVPILWLASSIRYSDLAREQHECCRPACSGGSSSVRGVRASGHG